MLPIKDESSDTWIIGYGNPQRRDDGIGPYVINMLNTILGYKKEIHILSLHQLEPDLIEELRYANLLIFVDAAMGPVEGEWQWVEVQPELRDLHYVTHHFKPSFLLGLLQSIYHRCPRTWMLSVQGDDFEFGEGLTRGAEKRARMVVSEIASFILNRNDR